ncbi:MAG: hypothetical protein ACRD28_08120 [Acidobacteriaceae bacterium]
MRCGPPAQWCRTTGYPQANIVFDLFPRRTSRTDGTPGVLLEETERTLFCSDLFHQWGHREPATDDNIMDRCRDALLEAEAGPFANYVPYTHHTGRVLESLAEHRPKTLATMHGSTYYGDGAQALRDLATVMREVLGPKA